MDIKSKIESLLFVSGSPLKAEKIARILDIKKNEAEAVLEELRKEYKSEERGVQVAAIEDKYQLVTHPENSGFIEKFLNEEVIGELTRPQLETLTIIAYRGPVAKIELEQIRGVNCTLILRNLMIRGLVEGRGDENMEKYVITHDFLKFLGIVDVKQLPDYEKLRKDKNLAELLDRVAENN